jgi:hypothetical protein
VSNSADSLGGSGVASSLPTRITTPHRPGQMRCSEGHKRAFAQKTLHSINDNPGKPAARKISYINSCNIQPYFRSRFFTHSLPPASLLRQTGLNQNANKCRRIWQRTDRARQASCLGASPYALGYQNARAAQRTKGGRLLICNHNTYANARIWLIAQVAGRRSQVNRSSPPWPSKVPWGP